MHFFSSASTGLPSLRLNKTPEVKQRDKPPQTNLTQYLLPAAAPDAACTVAAAAAAAAAAYYYYFSLCAFPLSTVSLSS